MKKSILLLATASALMSSCKKDKSEEPTPITPIVTKSLYVSTTSETISGSTVTIVSSLSFSGSHQTDSGYVRQSTASQGQTASIVGFMRTGSTVSVYTYAPSGYCYLTVNYKNVKVVNRREVTNKMNYYINSVD